MVQLNSLFVFFGIKLKELSFTLQWTPDELNLERSHVFVFQLRPKLYCIYFELNLAWDSLISKFLYKPGHVCELLLVSHINYRSTRTHLLSVILFPLMVQSICWPWVSAGSHRFSHKSFNTSVSCLLSCLISGRWFLSCRIVLHL